MDKEQAKFLLSSYRPDGADANSPDFAEALRFAAEDREVGEWLANERAMDAAFAEALATLPIPAALREEILAVLEYDGGSVEGEEMDAAFIGGLASVQPPAGLRDQILTAMNMEAVHLSHIEEEGKVTDIKVGRWLTVAAIAAAVAVVSFLSFLPTSSSTKAGSLADGSQSAPESLIGEESVVAVHNAMTQVAVTLDKVQELQLKTDLSCTDDAIQYLNDKSHPVPEKFPVGLEGARLMGARELTLDGGQPVSLLCFEKENMGMVHLIVVDSKRIEDADVLRNAQSLSVSDCYGCTKTQFNIVRWKEGELVYMLLTKAETQRMINLF